LTISQTAGPLLGHTEPRLYTPALNDLTLGAEARRFAADIAGIELYPWQEWLLDRGLELREPWTDYTQTPPFRYRTLIILVARQNGKTLVLQIRALAGLFLWNERLAVSLAQTRDVAYEPWRQGADLVENQPALSAETRSVYRSNGKEAIELRNGARWKVCAANSGGRGLSSDSVFMDELRTQDTWATWSAVDKTRSAHRNSQLWGFSNAGSDSSLVLNEFQRLGRALCDDPERNPSFGYFEWSAPEGCDPSDPEARAQANPSLGYGGLQAETLEAEYQTEPLSEFLPERLCVRVANLETWLPADMWEACSDPAAQMPEGPVTFAVDASPAGDLALVAAAGECGDGRTHVELAAEFRDTYNEPAGVRLQRAIPGMLENVHRNGGVSAECVYDPRGPIAGLCAELTAAGYPVRALTAGEVRDANNRFYDLVRRRALVHRADPVLAAHIGNAVPSSYGDSWTFSRRNKNGGPITALCAAVMACHASRAPRERPANWTAY